MFKKITVGLQTVFKTPGDGEANCPALLSRMCLVSMCSFCTSGIANQQVRS